MKVVGAIGLKTATKEEIAELISKHRGRGCRVIHKTTRSDGTPLPYNGVLILKR